MLKICIKTLISVHLAFIRQTLVKSVDRRMNFGCQSKGYPFVSLIRSFSFYKCQTPLKITCIKEYTVYGDIEKVRKTTATSPLALRDLLVCCSQSSLTVVLLESQPI